MAFTIKFNITCCSCTLCAAQAAIALESTRREQQYREMQSALAHANRVGHLKAIVGMLFGSQL
jgi:hypothetical protein